MKELVSNNIASIEAQVSEGSQKVMTRAEIQDMYGSELDGNPSVYCGTYGKYNNGSLFGLWLDITKFNDYDEFIDVCRQLHADEEDPELMFQDYECFPRELYSESCMDEDTFDQILEYGELSEDEKEAVDNFLENNDFDMEKFREAYVGKWDSEEEFAYHIIEECYDLDKMMGDLSRFFDYDAFASELFDSDYYMGDDGHVFRNC